MHGQWDVCPKFTTPFSNEHAISCMIPISFKLTTPGCKTDVWIKAGILSEIAALLPEDHRPASAMVITDSNVGPLYADRVQNSLRSSGLETQTCTFEAGEGSKTIQTASRIFAFLADAKLPRDGLIVALGGGVVGDLAGFVAGTWMRGVSWINCPTTMEADVDAALGGKTAVNLSGGKNLVGVFHHPIAVAVDPDYLSTLPPRDVRAGLAESIKHALLDSPEVVAWHEKNGSNILALEPSTITELIERNLQFKGQIVSEDPQEHLGRRILLNFGHTLGHAIESSSEGTLRHGECVSLGMLAACRISRRAGLLGAEEVEQVRRTLDLFELPTRLNHPFDKDRVLQSLPLDKKNTDGKMRLVLLQGIGSPIVRNDIALHWIADAYDSLLAT